MIGIDCMAVSLTGNLRALQKCLCGELQLSKTGHDLILYTTNASHQKQVRSVLAHPPLQVINAEIPVNTFAHLWQRLLIRQQDPDSSHVHILCVYSQETLQHTHPEILQDLICRGAALRMTLWIVAEHIDPQTMTRCYCLRNDELYTYDRDRRQYTRLISSVTSAEQWTAFLAALGSHVTLLCPDILQVIQQHLTTNSQGYTMQHLETCDKEKFIRVVPGNHPPTLPETFLQ